MGSTPTGGSGSLRRYLIVILSVGILGALAGTAVVSAIHDDPLAQLRLRDDAVSVLDAKGVSGKGREGQRLADKEHVVTSKSGHAQVDFFDGSLVRMDVLTELVVDRVSDGDDGRFISLGVASGRTWNNVAEFTSPSDRFEVEMPGAVASVRGTTFIVDCRRDLQCYVLGVEGDTDVRSSSGDSVTVNDGDCVGLTDDGGLAECHADDLGLVDDWVKQNLAEDQQLAVTTPTPKPTPTPTPTRTPRRTPAVVVSTPVPIPTATPTPKPTPKATIKPLKTPKATLIIQPSPTPTEEPDIDA